MANAAALLKEAEQELYGNSDFGASALLFEKAVMRLTGMEFSLWLTQQQKCSDKLLLEVTESYGVACMNANEPVKAMAIFKKVVSCFDFANTESYLSLAQLLSGKEALAIYNSCLQRLPKDGERETRTLRSSIYCSIAELYLSDLCFEPNAEDSCHEALTEANSLTPDSFEVSQLFCSFFISKRDTSRARMYILNTVSRLEANAVEDTVPFEFKVQTARLLLELGENLKAIDVLIRLIDEDDEIVETWLLLTEAYLKVGEKDAGKMSADFCQGLLKRFKEVDPDNDIFSEQQQRLLSLLEA